MNTFISKDLRKKIQLEFKQSLQEEFPNWAQRTADTYVSDSFYVFNNDIGMNPWSCFVSDSSIEEAREGLKEHFQLRNRPRDGDERADVYWKAMKMLKLFLDRSHPGLAAEMAEQTQAPSCWLFQCNPKHYDLFRALREKDALRWKVNQYAKRIQIGDKVYLWISGSEGGIVASGTIQSLPEKRLPDPNDSYWVDEHRPKEEYLGVDVSLERTFIDSVVSRGILSTDERTKNLGIFTFPNGTNFHVAREQEAVICPVPSLLDNSNRRYTLYQRGAVTDVEQILFPRFQT